MNRKETPSNVQNQKGIRMSKSKSGPDSPALLRVHAIGVEDVGVHSSQHHVINFAPAVLKLLHTKELFGPGRRGIRATQRRTRDALFHGERRRTVVELFTTGSDSHTHTAWQTFPLKEPPRPLIQLSELLSSLQKHT